MYKARHDGKNPFFWFGVVEDRQDEKNTNDKHCLGRVRVRIFGTHSPFLDRVPLEGLYWAQVIYPVTSAGMHGIGISPHGLVEGSQVFGVAFDGEACQDLYVIGSLQGIPVKLPSGQYGFEDPTGKYPEPEYLYESDVHRLARQEFVDKTIVADKNDARVKAITKPDGSAWDQPEAYYNDDCVFASKRYPYNKVMQTESGHIVEFDDTEGNERIHIYHKSGTFIEINQDGEVTFKTVGDKYQLTLKDEKMYVGGDWDVHVLGDINIVCEGNVTQKVSGDYKLIIDGNYMAWANTYNHWKS